MTVKLIWNKLWQFAFLFLIQLVLVNNLNLGAYFRPQIYIVFLLFFPVAMHRGLFLMMGFALGLLMDVFTYSLGFHALALLVMSYLRPYLLKKIEPSEGYESQYLPNSIKYDSMWFLKYAGVLIFVFHMVLFLVEKAGVTALSVTFVKIIASSLVSLIFAFIFRTLIQTK